MDSAKRSASNRRSGTDGTTRRGLLGTGAAATGFAGCGAKQEAPTEAAPVAQTTAPPPTTAATETTVASEQTEQPEAAGTHVYDTAGRTHGELTGTNDAQVVLDAIEDRPGQAGIVVPDPGFALEWEQQVDIPAAERGFSLITHGLPEIEIANDFSGDHMLNKPPTTEAIASQTGYRIGGFYVIDREYGEDATDDNRIGYGSNENLDTAFVLDDVKESVIEPSVFLGCPGIRIKASNGWSNQNLIQKPNVIGPRGPAVTLEQTIDNQRADQNWVFAPHFADDTNHEDSDVIAYVDQGNDNTWLWTRSEYCGATHRFDGCENYYVSEADWDRAHNSPAIIEVNGAAGIIHGLKNHGSYQFMRLSGLHTDIIGCTNQSAGLTGGKNQPPVSWTVVDLFDDLDRAVPAKDLEMVGFLDESDDGGSVTLEGGPINKTPVAFQTPDSANGTAQMSMGEGALQGGMTPKFGVSFTPRPGEEAIENVQYPNQPALDASLGGGDSVNVEQVVSRFGFVADEDNRIEFVYDPENDLGNHPTGNWYWEVVLEGETRTRTDTGFAPHGRQEFAINREGRSGPGRWTAFVDAYRNQPEVAEEEIETMFGPVPAGGVTIPEMTLRFRVRTLDDSTKRWWIETHRGCRLFVM